MSTGPQSALSFDIKNPTMADIVLAGRRDLVLDLSVAFPATVSDLQDGGAKVKVIPDLSDAIYSDEGVFPVDSLEIPDIPVYNPGEGKTGGGYLRFPVKVGDKGMVIVSDRSLDGWYEGGIPNVPIAAHTHKRIDGVFWPGLRDRSRVQSNLDQAAAVLQHECIKLGKTATEAAVLGNTLNTFIDALKIWADTHIHQISPTNVFAVVPLPTGAVLAPVQGPTNPATPTSPTVPDFLSSQVKIGNEGPLS